MCSPVSIGRPICKLALASEYLSAENELMANLRCTIYSLPAPIEASFYRGNQLLASFNKSSPNSSASSSRSTTTLTTIADETTSDSDSRQLVSALDLPVMVLNKQQEFLLGDLLAGAANFRCQARNAVGLSELCELQPSSKQMLLSKLPFSLFKPFSPQAHQTHLTSKLTQYSPFAIRDVAFE